MSIRLSLSLAAMLTVTAVGGVTSLAAQERSAVSTLDLHAAVAANPVPSPVAVVTVPGGETVTVARTDALGERVLAGGANRVVISTTAVIIALLILILVVD